MLQEILQADPVTQGWKSDEVRAALHLCLSCKGCKSECPVNVDMATYKAEFLHHYFSGRLRPVSHYAIGNIPLLARAATCLPGLPMLANAAASLAPLKKALGIHPERRIPPFAARPFRRGFKADAEGGRRVLLWTDTFNNYFTPHVLSAAAEVVRRAGWQVALTRRNICCGRPFYDFGMLKAAKRHLARLMDCLAPGLEGGGWIVGVEPSCIGVFRDELPAIFPDDPRARLLAERTLMLGEFLDRHTDFCPPKTDRRLVVHGHCHQKSVLGMEADEKLLRAASPHVDMLDSGCCGMAGAFGYEAEKYPVSQQIFGQALGPALQQAGPGAVIVATGFSCRTQIGTLAGRRALTLPEVLAGSFNEREGT
jgi:Fe-S oxidoreductase